MKTILTDDFEKYGNGYLLGVKEVIDKELQRRKEIKMSKSKFIQLTYLTGLKGYIRADIIVELYESKGVTYVYTNTITDDSPFRVKEHVDEILTMIGDAL